MPRLPLLAVVLALAAPACDEPCCTVDGKPIALGRGPAGALTIGLGADSDAAVAAVLDTAAPLTLFRGALDRAASVEHRTLRLYDLDPTGAPLPAVRALLRNRSTLTAPIGDLATNGEVLPTPAIVGGDLLRSFSLSLDGTKPAVTFWPRLAADDSFLGTSGYAVIHTSLAGGGQTDARGAANVLGERAPVVIARSRMILRVCAAPDDFQPDADPVQCCRGQERALASGTDVALVLATGVGPTVIGESAWRRIRQARPDLPEPTPGQSLSLPLSPMDEPLAAGTATLPRLAIVDQEEDDSTDPGACVELGRARRLEQVARRQARTPELATCAEPCDQQSSGGRARSSAAYVDIGGPLPVLVVPDDAPFLQALRATLRGEGPEVSGLLGASVLARLHLELDYPHSPARIVASCAPGPCAAGPDDPGRPSCWAAARCPRLPDTKSRHACFCLPPHGLPETCTASTCE